jgi:DNA-binding transcriptional LysR family regulator
VRVPVLSAGFCVLLPTEHPLASWRELPMTTLRSDRLIMLAGVPRPTPALMSAADDAAPPAGLFVVMPGVDSLKQAVANGLGIGIVPRAVVPSLAASAGLVVIPLSAARAAAALTLVYRGSDGEPNTVEDFVEALRSTGEDRAPRKAPIAMRASR